MDEEKAILNGKSWAVQNGVTYEKLHFGELSTGFLARIEFCIDFILEKVCLLCRYFSVR
jgi:hypothetical protein